jgi:hypothetical protein
MSCSLERWSPFRGRRSAKTSRSSQSTGRRMTTHRISLPSSHSPESLRPGCCASQSTCYRVWRRICWLRKPSKRGIAKNLPMDPLRLVVQYHYQASSYTATGRGRRSHHGMNDRLSVDNRVSNRTLNPKTLEFQSPLGIIECLAILTLRFPKGKKYSSPFIRHSVTVLGSNGELTQIDNK